MYESNLYQNVSPLPTTPYQPPISGYPPVAPVRTDSYAVYNPQTAYMMSQAGGFQPAPSYPASIPIQETKPQPVPAIEPVTIEPVVEQPSSVPPAEKISMQEKMKKMTQDPTNQAIAKGTCACLTGIFLAIGACCCLPLECCCLVCGGGAAAAGYAAGQKKQKVNTIF